MAAVSAPAGGGWCAGVGLHSDPRWQQVTVPPAACCTFYTPHRTAAAATSRSHIRLKSCCCIRTGLTTRPSAENRGARAIGAHPAHGVAANCCIRVHSRRRQHAVRSAGACGAPAGASAGTAAAGQAGGANCSCCRCGRVQRAHGHVLVQVSRAHAVLLPHAGKQQQRRQQLSVADAPDVGGSSSSGQQPTPAPAAADADAAVQAQAPQGLPARVWRRVLRELSSLPRAIGIMAVITALSALGTVIPQNKVRMRARCCSAVRSMRHQHAPLHSHTTLTPIRSSHSHTDSHTRRSTTT